MALFVTVRLGDRYTNQRETRRHLNYLKNGRKKLGIGCRKSKRVHVIIAAISSFNGNNGAFCE